MKHILLGPAVLGVLSLVGCDQDPVAPSAPSAAVQVTPPQKDLFSNWVLQTFRQTVAIDLRGVTFGSQPYAFYLAAGGACSCVMNVAGTQLSGTIVLASCVYDDRGSGLGDPGCAELGGTRAYSKTADTLIVCIDGTCSNYK